MRLGLTANLDYTLRVRFVNAAGPGEPSEPVRFYNGWRGVLPPSPHQAPPTYPNTAIRIITGTGVSDLGSHLNNYHGRPEFDRRTGTLTLRWMPGADTGTGPEVMYWRVRFTDELGLADPAPVPPTDVTLPLAVTSYTVRLPDPAVVPAGARGSIDVDVCVRATDRCYDFVSGDYQIPGSFGPTNLRAVAGDGQLTLTWDPPTENTATVTKYQYDVETGSNNIWRDVPDGHDTDTEASNERTVTVTGLTNGDRYTVRIRVVRRVAGSEVPGEPVAILQPGSTRVKEFTPRPVTPPDPGPAGIPQRPAGLTLWASGRPAGEGLLTWADPGDGTLTGYEHGSGYHGEAGALYEAPEWMPLPNSDARTTQARFRYRQVGDHGDPATGVRASLRAVNANGVGGDDVVFMPNAQFQAPARPTGLTATPAGTGQVTLRWVAPTPTRARTGYGVGAIGPLITDHRYTTDGGTTWHEIPASATGEAHATTYTVAGLPNGQAVTFHLLASNDEGASPVSEPVTATPQAVVPHRPGCRPRLRPRP